MVFADGRQEEDETAMSAFWALLELLGPTLVGIVTVPVFGYLKKLLVVIDRQAAWLQQILVVLVAAGLSWLGGVLDVALPGGLSFFTEGDVNALLAAALALAIHAGKKASADV